MSFSSTPLGQGRRLDHSTFLNKPPSNGNRAPSPRLVPTSYSYGAPTAESRSPNTSPTRERTDRFIEEDDQNDSALTRFARLKQREQASALSSRPGGPKLITSPPKPEKWSVKDTSVNIATAFTQAATDMQPYNHNSSWASSSSRQNTTIPRSTSVEYERESQAAISRRLQVPNSRHGPPRSTTSTGTAARRPLTKTVSTRHVSDSEGEVEHPAANERGKSPMEMIMDSAKRAIGPAKFYLQQKFQEPSDPPPEPNTTISTNGRESSYDYTIEEKEFQASQQTRRTNNATHKRGRMSEDNKAYKPTVSDQESEEDYEDEDKTKRRRKKKKKEAMGGPLSGLPVISQDKRRKKRSKGSKPNAGEEEEEEEDDSSSEENTERQSTQRASITRSSAPPLSRQSVSRGSVPPEPTTHNDPGTTMDVEQGLGSITEVNEDDLFESPDTSYEQPAEQEQHAEQKQRRSTPRPPSSRIGGPIGSLVYYIGRAFKSILFFFIQFLVTTLYGLGRILGTITSTTLVRPLEWVTRSSPTTKLIFTFGKYAGIGIIIWGMWYTLQDPLMRYIPRSLSETTYQPPITPAADIAEMSARLQQMESALAGMSLDVEKSKVKSGQDAKMHSELAGRVVSLESLVTSESKRAAEAEAHFRNAAKEGLRALKQEVEVLQAQMQIQRQQQHQRQEKVEEATNDEEARARLKALEERVGSVEGSVKEALELSKKPSTGESANAGAAWWNKIASGGASKSGLVIKSTDGQDVTSLIRHLVDSAVSTFSKDTLARPDYALHSGGARVIPSLTSPTFEIRPETLRSQLVGLVTGNGYAIGHPPVMALHPELHSGRCWPFAGSSGQLGVVLAAPAYITDITIDHVAREVAFDMRSAPREMEVWAMVEGKDNIVKVKEWMAEKAARGEAAKQSSEDGVEGIEEVEEEVEYPKTLPRSPQYIRIANFTYDIYASRNIQTFPVRQEIRDLGVDFGIVVLRVKSNWGKDEFTCLYRMRVHGQRVGEILPPYPEELA